MWYKSFSKFYCFFIFGQNILIFQILSVHIPSRIIANWNFSSISDHWIDQRLQLWTYYALLHFLSSHFFFVVISLSTFSGSLIMKIMEPPTLLKVSGEDKRAKQLENLHFENELELLKNSIELLLTRWKMAYIFEIRAGKSETISVICRKLVFWSGMTYVWAVITNILPIHWYLNLAWLLFNIGWFIKETRFRRSSSIHVKVVDFSMLAIISFTIGEYRISWPLGIGWHTLKCNILFLVRSH